MKFVFTLALRKFIKIQAAEQSSITWSRARKSQLDSRRMEQVFGHSRHFGNATLKRLFAYFITQIKSKLMGKYQNLDEWMRILFSPVAVCWMGKYYENLFGNQINWKLSSRRYFPSMFWACGGRQPVKGFHDIRRLKNEQLLAPFESIFDEISMSLLRLASIRTLMDLFFECSLHNKRWERRRREKGKHWKGNKIALKWSTQERMLCNISLVSVR